MELCLEPARRNYILVKSDTNLLFHKRDPRAELSADAIEKAAEVIARQIVLKVARIEVIREIEDLEPQLVCFPGRTQRPTMPAPVPVRLT